MSQAAIIVLAAGGSTRLGRPKQLEKWQGKPLLLHAIDTAVSSDCGPVTVVLGSGGEGCKELIQNFGVDVTFNEEWARGMGSSIAVGLESIALEHYECIIIMLCDQPLVTCSILQQLLAQHRLTGAPIVACGYAGTAGPPALFHRSRLEMLLALPPNAGAKRILLDEPSLVVIPCPEASLDIDTEADVTKLNRGDT